MALTKETTRELWLLQTTRRVNCGSIKANFSAESIDENAQEQEMDVSPPRAKKNLATEAKKKAVPTPVAKKRTTQRKQEAEHWILRLICE